MVKKNYNDWSKEELIKQVEMLKKQKTYGLVWEKDSTKEIFDYYINWDGGKIEEKFPEAEHKFPVLKEAKDKEIITEKNKDYNLLIEGDNYHALATLNFTHNKAIDVIYIDPPYNTGNKDFKYNDQWVDKEDSYRHSKWLSFMERRLKLARELLKDSGVIFISIDDNEQSQLKILCDEIFGYSNFIANLVVQLNPRGRTLDKHFAKTHEYILVYAKKFASAGIHEITKSEEMVLEYNKEDKNGKYRELELRNRNPVFNRKNRPNLFYPLYVNLKNGDVSLKKEKEYVEVYPRNSKEEDGCWTWGKEKVSKNRIELVGKKVSTGAYRVYRKDRLIKESGETATTKEKALWIDRELNNENGKEELKRILNTHLFDFPKSVELIKKCLNVSTNKQSLVLDFMAGSGTTGQAVMELNEDGGNRRFILCTNNENNICTEVCYPRIKKVIQGYKPLEKERVEGLGGNLKYFKTDFVDSVPTDKNKKKIVDKSTEMICIKENAFNLIKENKEWKIFKNHNYYLGIIFDEDSIGEFVKEAKNLDKKIHIYVFSLDESVPEKEFKELKNKAKLCPIPEVILHVYRRIYK